MSSASNVFVAFAPPERATAKGGLFGGPISAVFLACTARRSSALLTGCHRGRYLYSRAIARARRTCCSCHSVMLSPLPDCCLFAYSLLAHRQQLERSRRPQARLRRQQR